MSMQAAHPLLAVLIAIVLVWQSGFAPSSCQCQTPADASRPAATAFDANTPNDPEKATSSVAETAPQGRLPAKVMRYSQALLSKYDRNGDARLERTEWQAMHARTELFDHDADGVITLEEAITYVAGYGARRKIRLIAPWEDASQVIAPLLAPTSGRPAVDTAPNAAAAGSPPPSTESVSAPAAGRDDAPRNTRYFVPANRLPAGLPDWFRERDSDGDGQLTLAEYAPRAGSAELAEFGRHDRNGDGLLTPAEYNQTVHPERLAPVRPPQPSAASQAAPPVSPASPPAAPQATPATAPAVEPAASAAPSDPSPEAEAPRRSRRSRG